MHAFLSQAYWSPGLPRERMERAVNNSLGIAVFHGESQVGFARLVTDYARFAYLADVYVLPEHCGKGLARSMVSWFHEHPALADVVRWVLFTRDAHGVYKPLGYGPPNDPDRFMQRISL